MSSPRSPSENSSFPISIAPDEEELANRRFVFFFINPFSGSNDGLELIESGVNHMTLSNPELCEIYIFDISEGDSGNKRAFHLLASAVEASKRKRDDSQNTPKSISTASSTKAAVPQFTIICAGGDGTIIWCITEMLKHNVDMMYVALGVIPCGTGNDFAIAFGWKNFSLSSHLNRSLKSMRAFVNVVLNAQVVKHDLWDVAVEKHEGGIFSKINSKSRQDSIIKAENVEGGTANSLYFLMSNYFSLGVESRIGRGFDKNRMRNKCLNKMCYGVEGIKIAFKKNTLVNNVVKELVEETSNTDKVVFSTKRVPNTPLLQKAVTLAALNIPSFSSGNDIWKSSRNFGIRFADKTSMRNSDLLTLHQKTGDELLEFVTFSRTADLGLEFIFKGQGNRIHQGPGPWLLNFNDISSDTRVYFQIDGEFHRMTQPKLVSIRHCCSLSVLVPGSL